MQTISVPKTVGFVEFQLENRENVTNGDWIEVRFIDKVHGKDDCWGIAVVLPNRTIIGKLNTKPEEPWVIMEFMVKSRKFVLGVVRDPEDDYMLITLR